MSLNIYEVPSKCRFDLLQITLEFIRDGRGLKEIAEVTEQHSRHAHFLIQNAVILGLARREISTWELTTSGRTYIEAKSEEKRALLVKSMIESRLISFIIGHVGSLDRALRLSSKQISQLLITNTILSKGSIEGISKTTADRRAASVKGWLKWLGLNTRRISDDPEDKLQLAEQETLEFYDEP